MKKSSFTFNPYPFRYIGQYTDSWQGKIEELPNDGAEAERQMPQGELQELIRPRVEGNPLPLVSYTNQYALGCFEGLKAYPQKDGSMALFRPEANAQRFYNSMKGLLMPPFPPELFLESVFTILRSGMKKGYKVDYDPAWEKNNFLTSTCVYIRPFTNSESGIGVNVSKHPYVIIVATEVGSYYDVIDCPSIIVSESVRATPNGTGWIKSASNYVISTLEKHKAITEGYVECLFLDSRERKFVEECSSSNMFFVLKDDTVVTPPLGDTILPGITRDSIITLLKNKGVKVEERPISIDEVFDSAKESFATGTAVGVNHFGKIVCGEKSVTFGDGTLGEVAADMLRSLKQIQHGLSDDTHGWKVPL